MASVHYEGFRAGASRGIDNPNDLGHARYQRICNRVGCVVFSVLGYMGAALALNDWTFGDVYLFGVALFLVAAIAIIAVFCIAIVVYVISVIAIWVIEDLGPWLKGY